MDTLKQELKSQGYIAESNMQYGRDDSIRALKQILESGNKLLKSIEENPDENQPMNNERAAIWISQGTHNLEESIARWYNASQKLQSIKFLQKLYEEEKVKE